ncbi:MAG: single-stranded DNA-binding protein [Actinobacteria bacterium HGW-Actinobacteria-7]|jgi:single-strand DNA-binding protein|nr:MAG: single-stranded DNA-binding protein [Actinobacteria bacterium HGW-Actinobacteria-7]
MSINRVVITGNLTRDPELTSTGSGMAILKMGIAVNDRRKNQQSGEWEDVPNFFDVVVFGQRGESISRFLSKGSKVAIEGKLRWRSWETPEGDKRSKIEIIADDIEFMSSRDGGSNSGGGYTAPAAPAKKAETSDTFEDDIPF